MINLDAVMFEYVDGKVKYGWTIYDEEDACFGFTDQFISDDLELLMTIRRLWMSNDVCNGTMCIFDYIFEECHGILINNRKYEWDDIEDIMK